MTQWLQAHDLVSTDWDEADPRNRLRPRIEAVAEFTCDFWIGNNHGECGERFFSEAALEMHRVEDHDLAPLNLDLRPYDPVYRPAAERKSTPKGEGPGDNPRPRKRRMMWYDR